MAQFFQITVNEILSGISRAIYEEYGSTLSIYKEKQEYLELPGVCIYCVNYEKVMGRNDRFTNTFNIIINYFPEESNIINNNRPQMFTEVERIMNAIKYITLPAYKRDENGNLVDAKLLSRAENLMVEEQEEFIQISATYTVRTKEVIDICKMAQLETDVTHKSGG